MQNTYSFTLPKGYLDEQGKLHRNGVMRLATAKDEIIAMNHPKAKQMREYGSIILLANVITELEEIPEITPEIIESFYTADVNFLQNMYETINQNEDVMIRVTCPHCGKVYEEVLNFTQAE